MGEGFVLLVCVCVWLFVESVLLSLWCTMAWLAVICTVLLLECCRAFVLPSVCVCYGVCWVWVGKKMGKLLSNLYVDIYICVYYMYIYNIYTYIYYILYIHASYSPIMLDFCKVRKKCFFRVFARDGN